MIKRQTKVLINCLYCGKEKYIWPSRIKIGKGKFCSTRCGKMGNNNSSWKGGFKHIQGYKYILNKNHPHATMKGYVKEHHLVVEKKIGRFLLKGEVIHHINGIRNDNRIENLQLCKNQREHMNIHKDTLGRYVSFLKT